MEAVGTPPWKQGEAVCFISNWRVVSYNVILFHYSITICQVKWLLKIIFIDFTVVYNF